MKLIMEAISIVIDLIAVLIQVPYLYIASMFLVMDYEKNKYDKKVYAWIPTMGFLRYQYAENGKLYKTRIKYKNLLK